MYKFVGELITYDAFWCLRQRLTLCNLRDSSGKWRSGSTREAAEPNIPAADELGFVGSEAQSSVGILLAVIYFTRHVSSMAANDSAG